MNKRYINYMVALLCLVGVQLSTQAQSFDDYKKRVQSEFDQYKSNKDREFKEYRDRINAEFAEYMRQAWPAFRSKPAEPVPDSPEPPKPVVKDPEREPSNDPVPFDRVIPALDPITPPQPFVPLPDPGPGPQPAKPQAGFSFSYYGATFRVPLEEKHRFSLAGIGENDVADGWETLSSDNYLPVIAQCLLYRDNLQLGDWGYVYFVEQMTTAFFSAKQQNEARLMQMYILTQSGYKVRLARVDERLALLLSSKDRIYGYSYLTIDQITYYLFEPTTEPMTINVFNREFPKEQDFSLLMAALPLLPFDGSKQRHLHSDYTPSLDVEVSVNRNLIAFFNDYPLSSHWNFYANASLSEDAKMQLYPALQNVLAGKSKPASANILLHFVQTAFDYATDDEQFGMERPLFADEMLYYPYSDCEDRAILYSILVRELLQLPVVLLHYPGHLATAVCFDTDVPGDHLLVDGRRYVVCDPTYINANIGEAMPQFKQTNATVVRTASSN